jgi:2-dehydro-3-deoxygluconokinase
MRICCAGEVMVELAQEGRESLYRKGVAGDSFNTAVYLARTGLDVEFLTRLGDDDNSLEIAELARAEEISTDLIEHCPGQQPGLYLIDNEEDGERRFTYWREHSPARELFDFMPALPEIDAFYFTGITLAVARSGVENLVDLLQELGQIGATVIFDPNYRPRLWQDQQQAQEHYQAVLPLCDIILPTLADETALWGIDSIFSQTANPVKAIDTTGAGDAFNAGYLAHRLRGGGIPQSVTAAQQLAAVVVQHPGAIAPRLATQVVGH